MIFFFHELNLLVCIVLYFKYQENKLVLICFVMKVVIESINNLIVIIIVQNISDISFKLP